MAQTQTTQPEDTFDGNQLANCTSCTNQNTCQFPTLKEKGEVCSNYKPEITAETTLNGDKPYIRFHSKPNNQTTPWYYLYQDNARDSNDSKGTIAYLAAQTLHCNFKDVNLKLLQANSRNPDEITPEFIQELEILSKNPELEQFLMDEIHKTVSYHDDHIVKVDFYTAISAYLEPLNFALKCESGSGKTYSTVQTILFIPPEDVQMIASQSPKVISHENGILLDKNGHQYPKTAQQNHAETHSATTTHTKQQ
jgi:hypothetical protein